MGPECTHLCTRGQSNRVGSMFFDGSSSIPQGCWGACPVPWPAVVLEAGMDLREVETVQGSSPHQHSQVGVENLSGQCQEGSLMVHVSSFAGERPEAGFSELTSTWSGCIASGGAGSVLLPFLALQLLEAGASMGVHAPPSSSVPSSSFTFLCLSQSLDGNVYRPRFGLSQPPEWLKYICLPLDTSKSVALNQGGCVLKGHQLTFRYCHLSQLGVPVEFCKESRDAFDHPLKHGTVQQRKD